MGAYEDYSPRGVSAAKWLHPDGSVTDAEGNVVTAANEAGALDYQSRSAAAAKWLLADGSVVSELAGAGTGSDGGTAEPPPAAGTHLPIIATDALGGVSLAGDIALGGWGDAVPGTVRTLPVTDSAGANIV